MDEKYTRPQGLYQHKDVDHKKLRKLILDSKLAPCYPGDDDCSCDLEECPICFLYYPSLNRSRCCTKGICTECFLQMKTPNSTRPTQCPFCKTLNYAVEYRGVKTKEEKGQEQIEEQRVIEAKIRMRQQEIQDEEERMLKRQERSSSSRIIDSNEAEYFSRAATPSSEGEEIVSAPNSGVTTFRHPQRPRDNREDEFDLDPENIMLMEAIWLSFQEDGKNQRHNVNYGDAAQLAKYATEVRVLASMAPQAESSSLSSSSSSSSPSGGLACAIAALAERQQMGENLPRITTTTMATYHQRTTSCIPNPPHSILIFKMEDGETTTTMKLHMGIIMMIMSMGDMMRWRVEVVVEEVEVVVE